MRKDYAERVEEAGDEFSKALPFVIGLIRRGPKPAEGSIELAIAETLMGIIQELERADLEIESAREKALRDLNRVDGSRPGDVVNNHGSSFPFTYGWAAQLDSATSRYDLALRTFWSAYEIGAVAGMWPKLSELG